MILAMPDFRQSYDYDCGASVARSVAAFFEVGGGTEAEYIQALGTDASGTEVKRIVAHLRSFGLAAAAVSGMTLAELRRYQTPVICAIQDQDHGHYVVVIGMDATDVHLHDPWSGRVTMRLREQTWRDTHLTDAPYIHVLKGKTGERLIGLDTATANFLRSLKRNRKAKDGDLICTNARGTPWDRHTFARHLRRYAERLGIDEGVEKRVSGYCLRHTYVCDGIEAGVTTRRIADQVGHTKTDMIDNGYGSHTRKRILHVCDVATEMLRKRKRQKSPKIPKLQRDGFHQGSLFPDETK